MIAPLIPSAYKWAALSIGGKKIGIARVDQSRIHIVHGAVSDRNQYKMLVRKVLDDVMD